VYILVIQRLDIMLEYLNNKTSFIEKIFDACVSMTNGLNSEGLYSGSTP
jgi:hypothetical protein